MTRVEKTAIKFTKLYFFEFEFVKQDIETTIKRVKKKSSMSSKRIESRLHKQKMKTKQLSKIKTKHETTQLHEVENLSHEKSLVRQLQSFKLSISLMMRSVTMNLMI